MSKDYLGDGVYVDVECGMLKLTTEDGVSIKNEIFLEPEVYAALVRYVERISRTNRPAPESPSESLGPDEGDDDPEVHES